MDDSIREMLGDCFKCENELTMWEIHFIDSIYKQLEKADSLSPKQVDKLKDIWSRL